MVNKQYSLAPLKKGAYAYIGFSLTSERLDNYYLEIESDLRDLAAKGKILLDLLSSNGDRAQRFATLYFDGNKFDLESLKHVSRIDTSTLAISDSFYRKHLDSIDNSVLTSAQKFLFKKKLSIGL